jgi:glycosyltransferase involved in cell wall biosynthesis
MTPLVTVGIPFYNAQATLADAIRSVYAQTLTDWELILVDDGSSDGSLGIARSVDDSRVRVVSDGPNFGLSARLNQIAQLARGDYLARMDADDLMHPARLEAQLDFLRRQPDVDVVGTGMFMLDEAGRPVAKRLPPLNIDANAVLRRGAFAHATVMGRVDWFRSKPYDSAFDGCEDRELWLRSFTRSRFANLTDCYYFCAEHRSFSLRNYSTRCRLNARVYRKHASAFVGRGTALVLAGREELKPVIHMAAVALGLDQRLLGRRNQPLSSEETGRAEEALLLVRGTALPLSSEPGSTSTCRSAQPLPHPSPLVTVGISFYNAERTLADAIRSVLSETLADWELILVDDGSTDGSLATARSVADARVRVVSDGRNLGLAARLNQIAQLARGKYLARMDADDMMHRDRFATQVEVLDQNPAVDVVGTGMYILDTQDRPVGKRVTSSASISVGRVFAGDCLKHATVMGKTDWFRRNAYDPTFRRTQDFELWCRTIGHSRFARIPVCYYYCTEYAAFSLSKYAGSTWSIVRTLWKHGVPRVGFLACCVLSFRQLLKLLVYAAASTLRVHGRLVAQRSTALGPSEIAQVAADIAYIRSTTLPIRLAKFAEGQPGF